MARLLGICMLVLASASTAFGQTNGGVEVIPVPEPGVTALLMAAGAYALARVRRTRD